MRLGIRLQILLSLGALLVVAFVPLYVAVARLAEASLASTRRDAGLDLGRAVASHVLTVNRTDPSELGAVLEAQLSDDGVHAIGVYDERGARTAVAGAADRVPATIPAPVESARDTRIDGAPSLFVVVPADRGRGAVALSLSVGPGSGASSPLVRLVALYTGVVALTLLVFAYFAMTRLVVRPIEAVSRAAGRVAAGARDFSLPAPSAQELAELAGSLHEMTTALRSEEEALRSKVTELEAAKRELEISQESVIRSERLASVGRLAAGVAHEIGNPIAAILGFEELLLTGDLPEDEQRDFLVRMKAETERVNRVLRDLLDFARPHPESPESRRARANPKEAIDIVAALVKPQKRMQALALELDFERSLPDVTIGLERLQQVLLNLVLNAADAATTKILVRATRDADVVRLTVEDDGPGVAADVREKLFEPFVTTKDVGKGTGLGLAVCRGLVEAAGGTISLGETSLGGAAFVVMLRAAPPLEP